MYKFCKIPTLSVRFFSAARFGNEAKDGEICVPFYSDDTRVMPCGKRFKFILSSGKEEFQRDSVEQGFVRASYCFKTNVVLTSSGFTSYLSSPISDRFSLYIGK